ncbi:MAG TPA: VanW family protein [Coriobacteriia bacterium]
MTEENRTHGRRSDRHGRGGRSSFAVELPGFDLGRYRSALLAGAGLVALVLMLAAVDVALSWGRVHPGVTVGGVGVGGMTRSGARGALERELGPRLSLPVTVAYESRRWTVTPGRVGARLDAEAGAEAAYAVGRTGSLWAEAGSRFGAWFGRDALAIAAKPDASRMRALLSELRRAVDVPAQDATVTVAGTDVTRTAAKPGLALRGDLLTRQLLTAFLSQQRIVRMSVGYAPVSVTDADAQQAYDDARRMVGGDVSLAFETKSWTVPARQVGGWIAFRTVPWSPDATAAASAGSLAATSASGSVETTAPARPGQRMLLVAYVDADEVSSTVAPLVRGVGKPARDATFQVVGKSVRVIAGQVGVGIDIRGLAAQLDAGLRADGSRRFVMALTQTQPKLTTQQAQGMGITGLISSYSTEYDPGNAPRVNNIHTLAKALDGKLVPPGGVFSFNGAVGERTAERGYQEAPAIVNGKLVPQLGGGICQIGTTFFNAVFFSGFPVLERTNHSFYISHYPKGRDATVSWGGPDLRWKNDGKSWVLIHTSFSDSSVTISLYGTDPGYKVAYTTGPFTDPVPHKTVIVKDPTLPLGKTVVSEAGVDGRKVVVVRTVTLNGSEVRRDTFVSVYKPKDETVKVGALQPAKPATATPVPKP